MNSMNFAGFIPLYRSLIQHTIHRRMTNNEALAYMYLLMLADRKTGSYTINAATLRFYLPGLTKSGAQDALEGLQRKHYIYRDIKPRSPLAYRYWVNGFRPTDGPQHDRQLDLSEVFATRDTSRLKWIPIPADDPLDTLLDAPTGTPLDTPKNNDKREERSDKKQEIQLTVIRDGETERFEAQPLRDGETGIAITAPPERAMAGRCATVRDDSQVLQSPQPRVNLYWRGVDKGFVDFNGRTVFFEEVNKRIAPLNLVWEGGEFTRMDDGSPVPHDEVYQLINERSAA